MVGGMVIGLAKLCLDVVVLLLQELLVLLLERMHCGSARLLILVEQQPKAKPNTNARCVQLWRYTRVTNMNQCMFLQVRPIQYRMCIS
jgi:hypothetical protein